MEDKSLSSIKETVYGLDDREKLANEGLFLAQNDLENDMIAASSQVEKDFKSAQISKKNVVTWLQEKKSVHMVEFTKIMKKKTAKALLEGMDGVKEFFDDSK